MKTLTFLLSLCGVIFLSLTASAQAPAGPKGNSQISGVVVDSASGKPVEFATIALLNPTTNKPVDGTSADVNGKFTIENIAPGTYRLLLSFIGYRDKRTEPFTIAANAKRDMGTIRFSADVKTLKEVTVVGQAAIVEEKVDRLVFNADKDLAAKGGDATEILRKVPMLSVDLDGNVSLRGSSNIRVLINNKPSSIMASNVADALKQIPADQIQRVEVITSPSAKYDAEGSGGIINIITKKTSIQGATLNVDGGVGNRGSQLGLNGNLRTGKMGFSLGLWGRSQYNVKGSFSNQQSTRSYDAVTNQYSPYTYTNQSSSTLNSRLFGNTQLGWDYDISKTSTLSASVRYGVRNGTTNQSNLLTTTYSPNAYFPIISDRNVLTKDRSGSVDANVTYTKTYKPQKELSVMALYSINNQRNNMVADILSNTDFATITSRQRNDNPGYNTESSVQLDYQTPINDNQVLEIGGKGTFRTTNSDFQYYIAQGANGEFVLNPNINSNALNYQQDIAATYLSYTYTSKTKWSVKAGARYEYTFVNAKFSNETGSATDIPDYGNLVPSLNISKALGGGKIVKLGYNRRIQRPNIRTLNPYVDYSNPTNISRGNPYLSPEVTDNIELGYSTNLKGLYLNSSLFARRTANEITSVRDVTTQILAGQTTPVAVINTTFQNIGYEDAVGLNLFGNGNLFKKLQLGGGVDIMHISQTNNSANPIYAASNAGWVVGGRMMASMSLVDGWGFQLFGGGRGKQVQLQGYQSGMYFYSLGIRKEFNDKKASLGLAAENIFNHPFRMRTEVNSPLLTQYAVNNMYNAGVRLTFSYKLGKMNFQDPKRRRNQQQQQGDVEEFGGGR